MTLQQAIADIQAAANTAKSLLPMLAAFAPGPVAAAVAASDVIEAASAIAAKIENDATANVDAEQANLKSAHDAMVAAVAQLDAI